MSLEEAKAKINELQNITPRTQEVIDDIEYYKWVIKQLTSDVKPLS